MALLEEGFIPALNDCVDQVSLCIAVCPLRSSFNDCVTRPTSLNVQATVPECLERGRADAVCSSFYTQDSQVSFPWSADGCRAIFHPLVILSDSILFLPDLIPRHGCSSFFSERITLKKGSIRLMPYEQKHAGPVKRRARSANTDKHFSKQAYVRQ
jgi:hypothetical protein